MDLWEAFEKRRTIRKFSGPPTDEQIDRVLQAGSLAPSAGDKQAWFVVIVNDSEIKEKISEIKKGYNATWTPDTDEGRAKLDVQKKVFKNCTSLVFYTFAPEPEDPHRADMGSVWMQIENVCLAAVAEGLGTQLFGLSGDVAEGVNTLLGVPAEYRLVIGVNIGLQHPDYKIPKKTLKPTPEWIFREKWPVE
jgi:nitroreductase